MTMEATEFMKRFDTHSLEMKGVIEAMAKKMQDEHVEVTGMGARIKEMEQLLASRQKNGGGDIVVPTWGGALIGSDEFKHLLKVKRGNARVEVKQVTTNLASGGALIAPDHRLDPVMMPRRRLGIRDLLSQGNTNSNAVKYVRQTGRTLAANAVSEGTDKPESNITFELVVANVTTIAHWMPASKQVLDDAPALQTIIDSELRYGVAKEEEEEILLGDGSGETLLGLVPQASAYAAPFQPEGMQRIDYVLLAAAQLALIDFDATGVVVNPVDWARIRTTKDSNGNYMAGGPLGSNPKQLWELPVVASNSIAAGKFLVGDFKRAAIVFDREETAVEISTEHEDFFTRNMVAIRGEKRCAMAVQQPEALVYGTFQVST